MKKINLGILREGKVPPERRVPFTPQQAAEIMRRFPHVTVLYEKSDIRCFTDAEYAEAGIPNVSDAGSCDVLMGIKEVPVSNLRAGKTYLFFSHTMKMQPQNRELLQTVLEKKIRLIDYEALRDISGKRLVAFGRYAGIVGTYNCFWVYGLRYNRYTLQRAFNCHDYDALKQELKKVDLPPVKIVLTGGGRVGRGAIEILDILQIRRVGVDEFLNETPSEPVYVQLGSKDYHAHLQNQPFDRDEFHAHPERYKSDFLKFAQEADMLIAGAYWNPAAPKLFAAADMTDPSFSIRIIADISCDIGGSIPATIKATDVYDPVYDYNPTSRRAETPFSSEKNITVMAVDNLPCELPRSASADFGRDLIDKILPSLLNEDTEGIIERATLAVDGELTEEFRYLEGWVAGGGGGGV
jgi:alanine dehydrogenase